MPKEPSSILLQHPTVTAILTPGFLQLALLALYPRPTKPSAAAGMPLMPRHNPGSCGPDSSGNAELKGRMDAPDWGEIGSTGAASIGTERAPGPSPSAPLKSARWALQGSMDAWFGNDEQPRGEMSSASPVLSRPAVPLPARGSREVAVFPHGSHPLPATQLRSAARPAREPLSSPSHSFSAHLRAMDLSRVI